MKFMTEDVSLAVNGPTFDGWVTLSSLDTGPSGEYTGTKKSLEIACIPNRKFLFCQQVNSLRVFFVDSRGDYVQVYQYAGCWIDSQLRIELQPDWPQTYKKNEFAGCLGDADGIISRVPSFVPGVTVADCIPIYLHQKRRNPSAFLESPVYGTLHSGWQGTGISLVALAGIKELWGVGPDEIEAGFGPGICGSCYIVDAERARIIESRFGSRWIHKIRGTGEWKNVPQYRVDLFGINKELAIKSGVHLIHSPVNCTKENEKYHSFRRSKDLKRMFAFTLGKDST
jgi:copper oxidase (laccase) domain-containing protein